MTNYDLAHSSRRWFLILATVGTPFVPVFSSGQFVSIRGTENWEPLVHSAPKTTL